ncbi:uncharacterized protein [Palaemon carinicauda]|uniref:uncharacterized protein n=1 Tax=Palaemon carinicauda TaxID=392227 RepID=UPI0035B58736
MDIGRGVIIPAVDLDEGGGDGGRRSQGGGSESVGGRDSVGGGSMRSEGRGGVSQGPIGNPTDRTRGGVNSAVSIMGWNGFSELAWKRRHANDPAMMRELRRYQKLMLLTLLPAITGSGEEGDQQNYLPPAQHPSYQNQDSEPNSQQNSPRDGNSPEDNSGDRLPKPEPTDAIVGVPPGDYSPLLEKQAGHTWARRESHPNSSSSSSDGTHLPLTVYNPLNMSPKRRGRRKSRDGHQTRRSPTRRRRQSIRDPEMDVRRDVAAVGSSGESPGSSANDSGGGGGGGGAGDFDLLTLAALYLESRHRIFGKEWHHRPESQANARPTGQLGSTGISRPRRLTPLSNNARAPIAKDTRTSFSGVMPAPAGLHLSVNYTQNLDLDESAYIAERARALKPRLRRLNSLDDMVAPTPLSSPENPLYRATSAPDLSQSAQARNFYSLMKANSKTSLDSISPPPVTPARANTPTGAKHSAALAKPQIVGGSLATNSAVELAASRSLSSSRGANFIGSRETKKTRAISEGSRNALLQPPPWGALPPDYKDLDIPTAPPPSAIGEIQRKNGKIHLEPLTIRKTSY